MSRTPLTEITFVYISPEDHSVVGTHVMKIDPPQVGNYTHNSATKRVTSNAPSR